MPVLFVGHGNPMNAIEDNSFSQNWRRIVQHIPKPLVIVVMSAHWVTAGHYLTSNLQPETIHDFYGFPDALYAVRYQAAGSPALVQDLHSSLAFLKPNDQWGLDHGAWSILNQMYPQADIPVLQLSVNNELSPWEEAQILKQIQFLRNYGVLFIGSGNIIHNLGLINWQDPRPYDWAVEFDLQVKHLLEKRDLYSLAHYATLGKSAHYSIPTDDHYRPMLAALALAKSSDQLHFFNEEVLMGSVGMRSFILTS